jgi:hypothetical protein
MANKYTEQKGHRIMVQQKHDEQPSRSTRRKNAELDAEVIRLDRERDFIDDDGAAEPPPLRCVDMSSWDDGEPPPLEWAVRDRMPRGQVGLFSGVGGAGMRILPAKDVSGAHGKTYAFLGVDELHTARSWDLLEALSPDPTRTDALRWITSYDTIYNTPGVPLYDLLAPSRACCSVGTAAAS